MAGERHGRGMGAECYVWIGLWCLVGCETVQCIITSKTGGYSRPRKPEYYNVCHRKWRCNYLCSRGRLRTSSQKTVVPVISRQPVSQSYGTWCCWYVPFLYRVAPNYGIIILRTNFRKQLEQCHDWPDTLDATRLLLCHSDYKFLCCLIAAVIVSLVTGETEFDCLKIKLQYNRMGKQRNFSLPVVSQNTTQRKHVLTYMLQSMM